VNGSVLRQYGLAIAATGLAFGIWLLDKKIAPSPLPLLLAAVVIGSWYGGLGPGLLSTGLGVVLALLLYYQPQHPLGVNGAESAAQVLVFTALSIAISWLNEQRRRRGSDLAELLARERSQRANSQIAEQTLRTVIRATPLSVVVLDLQGRVQSWNPAAERIFGWSEAEVLGKPAPTVPPDQMEASEEVRGQALRGEIVVGLDRRRLRKDRTMVEVSISTAALLDASGQARGTVVVAEDISGRRQAEEERTRLLERERAARAATEEAQERLLFLAEATETLTSSLDYEVTLTQLARMAVPRIADWCGVLVITDDGSVRQLAAEHIDPDKVELAQELAKRVPYDPDAPSGAPRVIRTGEPELLPEIPDELIDAASPDPEVVAIIRELGLHSAMTVPIMARGRILGALSLVAAESGRIYGSDDLALAQELADRAGLAIENATLYRQTSRDAAERAAILGQIGEGIILANPEGRIVFANAAARELYHLEPRDSLDPTIRVRSLPAEGSAGDADVLPLSRAAREGVPAPAAEWCISRPDGTEVIASGGATPIQDGKGNRIGAVLTVRDVTEQRTLERQKDEFLTAAAHDLKTPLTTIKALAQVLSRRVARIGSPETARVSEGLSRIDSTATRMAALINDLLDVTRLRMDRPLELNREPVDLVAVARRVVAEQRAVTGRAIRLHAGSERLDGFWDASRLERLIDNLLSNAVKYSPRGGDIDVHVAAENGAEQSWAVIAVTDRGIGIPDSELPHVFERFFRASNTPNDAAGTGVGLASVRQIVDQHRGNVSIESSVGQGTVVTVRLPLNPGRAYHESCLSLA